MLSQSAESVSSSRVASFGLLMGRNMWRCKHETVRSSSGPWSASATSKIFTVNCCGSTINIADITSPAGSPLSAILFYANLRRRLQCHPPVLGFEEGDGEGIYLAEFEFCAQVLLAPEFGDVYEARHALLYRSERAVFVVFDDHRIHFLVLFVFRSGGLPRVFDERLYRERYFVVLYLDDLHLDDLSRLVARLRIFD